MLSRSQMRTACSSAFFLVFLGGTAFLNAQTPTLCDFDDAGAHANARAVGFAGAIAYVPLAVPMPMSERV
jgi:hypothetical protein